MECIVWIHKLQHAKPMTISGNIAESTAFKLGDTLDKVHVTFKHKGSTYYKADVDVIVEDGVLHLSRNPNVICEDDIIIDSEVVLRRRKGFDVGVVRECALRGRWLMTRSGNLAKLITVKNKLVLQIYGRPRGYLDEVIDQTNIDLETLCVPTEDPYFMGLLDHKYDIVGLAHRCMMYNNKRVPE